MTQDLLEKWLNPETKSKDRICDQEQFLGMLNQKLQVWVKERTPHSSAEAVELVETFVAARQSRRCYQLGPHDSWRRPQHAAQHAPMKTPVGKSVGGRVVLEALRAIVLHLGHSIPWAGHLGREKSERRIVNRFYWPGFHKDISEYCRSCPECQLSARSHRGLKAPLISLPIIDVPFSRIAMDVVGPLERSRAGHRYILVICDYATRYPEAFPLRNTKARQVANCLIQLFSRVSGLNWNEDSDAEDSCTAHFIVFSSSMKSDKRGQ